MKIKIERLLVIFGVWSLFVVDIGYLDYVLIHLWGPDETWTPLQENICIALSGSVGWYVNIYTMFFTVFVSFMFSALAVVMLIKKSLADRFAVSRKFLFIWLALFSVNFILWLLPIFLDLG